MKIACQTLKETSIVKTIRLLAAEPFPPRRHVSSWGIRGRGGGGYTKAIKRLPVVTVFFFAYREINHGKWLKGRHHFESVNLKIL